MFQQGCGGHVKGIRWYEIHIDIDIDKYLDKDIGKHTEECRNIPQYKGSLLRFIKKDFKKYEKDRYK